MSHLSPAECIDLTDGALRPDRAAHLRGCAECRAQVDAVRDALALADPSDSVPEPSPLFWDQFSARVRDAIADTPERSHFVPGWRGWQTLAAALAVLVLVASAVFGSRAARPRALPDASAAPSIAAADPNSSADSTLDPNHAAAWAVLTAAAADLRFDEARDAGIDVPSAAVDRAVTQLTRDELSELGRLLQSEMKGSSN